MSVTTRQSGGQGQSPVQKMGGSSSLADVLDVVLDKGIVIDAWARVSIIGIEILTVEARVVVASVDTYLRYAEAIGLTALAAAPRGQSAGQNGRTQAPGEEEIMSYLSDHPEGLRLGEMEAYFNVPRPEIADVVNSLVENDQVERDQERQLYYLAEGSEG